jgi:hypothetical protein
MSTRSAIAVRNTNATYDVVYCHWGGEPENQMPILEKEHGTARKARKLITPGSMSSLKAVIDWDGKPKEPGPLYHVDRGELDCQPRRLIAQEVHRFALNMGCEHLYTYLPHRGWKHDQL